MWNYIIRRLLLILPTLIGVITITFFISEFVPGGPIDQIQALLDGKADKGASVEVSANKGDLTGLDGKKRKIDPKLEMRLKRTYGLNHSMFTRYMRTLLWFGQNSFISSREIESMSSERFSSRGKNCIAVRVGDKYYAFENYYEKKSTEKAGEMEVSEFVYDKKTNTLKSVIDGIYFDMETGKAIKGDTPFTLKIIPLTTTDESSTRDVKKTDNILKASDLELMINAAFDNKIPGTSFSKSEGCPTVKFEDAGRTITAIDKGSNFLVREDWTEIYRKESGVSSLFNWDNWHGFFLLKFGRSTIYNETVISLIGSRLKVSIRLGVISFFLTYITCILLGIAKAVRNGSKFDTYTSALILFGNSIPGFVLAVLLLAMFGPGESAMIHLFPLGGLHTTGDPYLEMSFFGKIIDNIRHLIAPIICLSIGSFAVLTMLTKNSVLEEVHQLYAVAARARGLSEKKVLYKHILRNSLIPLITGFPSSFMMMFFTGSLLIEKIFNLQGMGLLAYTSVMSRDFPIIMSSLFIFTTLGLLAQLLTDICYVIVDPRISFSGSKS